MYICYMVGKNQDFFLLGLHPFFDRWGSASREKKTTTENNNKQPKKPKVLPRWYLEYKAASTKPGLQRCGEFRRSKLSGRGRPLEAEPLFLSSSQGGRPARIFFFFFLD